MLGRDPVRRWQRHVLRISDKCGLRKVARVQCSCLRCKLEDHAVRWA
jgi:hypothetical protein